MTDQWLSAKQVAATLGISERTFFRIVFFRQRKRYPHGVRAVRYAASDVATYQALGQRKIA